jgi:hypothetical protein
LGDGFQLEGKSIDTEALERELARRVAARKESGAYSGEVEALLAERLPDEEGHGTLSPIAELDYAATRASSSWEVTAAYPVETEKGRLAKPLIIFVKRLARLWARIAVGPIQREQTAFNRHAAAALEAVRRQAVAERTEALAAEQDLAKLAGALLAEGEAAASASAIAEFFKAAGRVTVVGPCPSPVLSALAGSGTNILKVSAGSAWDEAAAGQPVTTSAAPISGPRRSSRSPGSHTWRWRRAARWLSPSTASRPPARLRPGARGPWSRRRCPWPDSSTSPWQGPATRADTSRPPANPDG